MPRKKSTEKKVYKYTCAKTGLPRDPEKCAVCSSFVHFYGGFPVCGLSSIKMAGTSEKIVETNTFTVSPRHAMALAFRGQSCGSPDNALVLEDVKKFMTKMLGTLTDREQTVLRLRFGLDNGVCLTLEEIAKMFKVTRTRIRDIEQKAIRKLRHPSRANVLKELI